MVKAIVTGVSSKMGVRLMQFVNEMEGIELVGAVDVKGSRYVGQDVGEMSRLGLFGVPVVDDLRDCIKHSCVVIDFTDKESSLEHLKIAAEHKTSMVIGTMGFMLDEMERIRELTKKTRCVLVPNVSPALFSEMGAGRGADLPLLHPRHLRPRGHCGSEVDCEAEEWALRHAGRPRVEVTGNWVIG